MTPTVPDVITAYFAAMDSRDIAAALAAFSPDATVVDDNRTFTGHPSIRSWLDKGTSEYTYTRTLIDIGEPADGTYLVRNRLEGNFPGGRVDLRYQFQLDNDLIARLEIAP